MIEADKFNKEGTPERVLLKGMLVETYDDASTGKPAIRFTERVQNLFEGDMPDSNALLEQMLKLVRAHVADESGILSGSDDRQEALAALMIMGMKDEGKFVLTSAIERGAMLSAGELARTRATYVS